MGMVKGEWEWLNKYRWNCYGSHTWGKAKSPLPELVSLATSRKRELERERQGPDTTRSPSPGIRFEEEEVS